MEHQKYDKLVRLCTREIVNQYVKKEPKINIESDNISVVRICLNNLLTTYSEPLQYYTHDKIDKILQFELSKKQIIDSVKIPRLNIHDQISLHHGDITCVYADCIVNAANSVGLGCFVPGHKCIDNVIHSKAGPKLREECKKKLGNNQINPGNLIVTRGFNLPSKYVFHVVGPIYNENQLKQSETELILSYVSCLNELRDMRLESIVFPCISTGEFGYPKYQASITAIRVVKKWLEKMNYPAHVVFCVFSDEDRIIYEKNMTIYLNAIQ